MHISLQNLCYSAALGIKFLLNMRHTQSHLTLGRRNRRRGRFVLWKEKETISEFAQEILTVHFFNVGQGRTELTPFPRQFSFSLNVLYFIVNVWNNLFD